MKRIRGKANRRGKIWGLLGIVAILAFAVLSGCSRQPGKEKTVVTILYSSTFEQLEQLVEATYSDIDLQAERLPYFGEQLRRLEKGTGPDLIVSNQPSSDHILNYLLDISDMDASMTYEGTIMKSAKREGKTYLLPLPGLYTGYIVNETLFQQAGVPLPSSNQELLDALVKLKEQGLGVGTDHINFSIQSNDNSSLGMFYVGNMVPDFLGTVEGVKWLAGYQRGETSFSGTWEKSFSLTEELVKASVLDPSATGGQRNLIRYRERMGNGTQAVVFGTSALYQQCVEENKAAVEAGTAPAYSYRMLPLMSNEGREPWVLFSTSAYIGINHAVNEKKQEACRRILELLSTPEGQDAVISDLGGGVSCLRTYRPVKSSVPDGIWKYVESGYVYNVLFPDKIVEYLGSKAREVLSGKLTVEEALKMVDLYYYEGSEAADYDLAVIGEMAQALLFQNYNVRREETEVGNFVADCVAQASGAPIAVVNGGGIRGSFYHGEVYGSDLAAVCPFDNLIVVLEMDGRTLWDMLENGLAMCDDEFPGGRFLQVSGLSYTFDSSRKAGSRLLEVKLSDGSALDMFDSYQVAVNNYMAGAQGYAEGNGDDYTMLNWYDEDTQKGTVKMVNETNMTYRDALKYFFDHHTGSAVEVTLEGRITDLAQNP